MALRPHPRWIILLCIATGLASTLPVLSGGCSDNRPADDAATDPDAALHAPSDLHLEPGEQRAAIIYSGALYGMIEACGCAGNPNGGMAKELTIVQHRRRAMPTLYVQPGKLFSFEPQPAKRPYIAKAARRMQWDAIGLGDHELVAGADALRSLIEPNNLPIVCANALDLQGRPIAQPYIIRELAGIRVGIFGLIGDERYLYIDKTFLEHVKLVPPAQAAARVLQELHGKVDYIILLSQQDRYLDRQLATAFPQINLIVSGNEPEMIAVPIRVGNALIVNAGVNGSFSGVVNLAIDPQRHVRVMGHEFLSAAASVPRHPDILAIYDAYLKETKEKPADEGGEDPLPPIYQPSSSCQPCHAEIHAQYLTTAHARAWDTLVKAGRADDPECSYCHSMGFGRKSGFQSIQRTPELANVSCQACHLVASDHNLRGTKPDLDYATNQRTCGHCHTPITSPKFNWWEAIEKIDHSNVKAKSNDPPPGYTPTLIEPVVPPRPPAAPDS